MDQQRSSTVDDLTSRLDRINVDMMEMEMATQQEQQQQQQDNQPANNFNSFSASYNTNNNTNCDYQQSTTMTAYVEDGGDDGGGGISDDDDDGDAMMMITEPVGAQQQQGGLVVTHHNIGADEAGKINRQVDGSDILIVTQVDPSIFTDKAMQSEFESLFLAFDPSVTFRYLKSFRRVRLDFTSASKAEAARSNLSHYRLGNSHFKCYPAQIIRPNNGGGGGDNMHHLNIPKLTKQFLISPPASPPIGWEPVHESSPCIDVQLISAIANLVPGKVHEIHPPSESQPGIFVEVCEEPQTFEGSQMMMKSCSRIPRTASPNFC